jgi:membrane protease YdiL (CAAX protease family)
MASPFSEGVRCHPVISFYVLAFVISWLGWVPQAAYSLSLFPIQNPLFSILGAGGPAFAALIVTLVSAGKGGVRELFAPLFRWRVSVVWYGIALFLQPLILLAAIGLDMFLGKPMPDFGLVSSWFIVLPMFLTYLLTNLWEEVGWRGFALPRLQARQSSLVSSLIIGVLWGLWHVPLFLDKNNPMSTFPFLAWFIGLVASAILYTWLYNNTKGSLLIVSLFHAAGNTATAVVFVALGGTITAQDFFLVGGITCFVVIIIVAVFGPARLSRTTVS